MNIGDFALNATIDHKFCTVQSNGAPFTLAGSPAISAYEDNDTAEITAGITLTVDFDGKTGLNHVRVVATSGNGFQAGANYQLVISAGTVNGVSVVNYVVGWFSIQARSLEARVPAALVSGRMDASVGAMAAGVIAAATFAANALDAVWSAAQRLLTAGTNIVLAKGVGVTGFNDVSAANVNAEVVDALNVDTYAEPAAVPAATSSLAAKLGWIFTLGRNKITQTATTQTLRNDADNATIGAATVSDDATTATRGEWT